MGEDDFKSFRTGIESAYKTEFAETETIIRSELVEALAKSTLDVMSTANDNILQQQRAMLEKSKQVEIL